MRHWCKMIFEYYPKNSLNARLLIRYDNTRKTKAFIGRFWNRPLILGILVSHEPLLSKAQPNEPTQAVIP
jgi:hypothetical protein